MGLWGFRDEDRYDEIIWTAARARGLDPLLVKAVIAKESSFNAGAYRAEPRINDASRGLMQVLYGTARDLGYTGVPDGLFDPAISIEYGTRYLARQQTRYQSSSRKLTDMIAAYNAGTAFFDVNLGVYANQDYVNSVLRYYEGYRNAEAQAPPSGGAPAADIPSEQSVVIAPRDEPSTFEGIWWDLPGIFGPAPGPEPEPAYDWSTESDPAVVIPNAAASDQVEQNNLLMWAGAALLGIAGILVFARGR
jgi:hypothetical protein